jgi:hypothetical protein
MAFWRRLLGQGKEPPADGGPRSLWSVLGAWDGTSKVPELEIPLAGAGAAESKAGWAPGAWDGVQLLHMKRPGPDDDAEAPLLAPLRRACRSDTEQNVQDLHAAAQATPLASCWEALLDRFAGTQGLDPSATKRVGERLRRRAAHPASVKLGILLAAATKDRGALADVQHFARHEEFGFWCLLAYSQIAPDPVAATWELARRSRGWAKIHAVMRLALERTIRPEIRAWLLREGCANDVSDRYLAWICARVGGLPEALEAPSADDALLEGASVILAALYTEGGPARTYVDWHESLSATRAFLRHAAAAPMTERRRAALEAIRRTVGSPEFLPAAPPAAGNDADAWLDRISALRDAGWTAEAARDVASTCDRLLGAAGPARA